MGNTAEFAFPYVEPGDARSGYPAADQAKVTAIEAAMLPGPVITTGLVTAVAGWSVASQQLCILGKIGLCDFIFNRTSTTDIVVSADGGFTDVIVATFNITTYPVAYAGPFSSGNTGRVASWSLNRGNGQIALSHTTPGSNITDTAGQNQWHCRGVIFLA